MTMKRSETRKMWCDKLWRTFGVCCVEVFLRSCVILIILGEGLSPISGEVTLMQYRIHTTFRLVAVIILAVCFALLCVKRGWYTQNNMRFLNIENAFFALPFLIWLCFAAYYDAWEVCDGILIATELCLPRAISCIAYYRRKRNNGTKEKSAARWGVMIAGMAMTWAAILVIKFWVAFPEGFWGKDGSKYILACQRGARARGRTPVGGNHLPRGGSVAETKRCTAKKRMDRAAPAKSVLHNLVDSCIAQQVSRIPEQCQRLDQCISCPLDAVVYRRAAHCIRKNMQVHGSTIKVNIPIPMETLA